MSRSVSRASHMHARIYTATSAAASSHLRLLLSRLSEYDLLMLTAWIQAPLKIKRHRLPSTCNGCLDKVLHR